MDLLTGQRNELFQTIQAVGLDPREFKWIDLAGDPAITHAATKSAFVIQFREEGKKYRAIYSPAIDLPEASTQWGSWGTTVSHAFPRWLEAVKGEAAPDLWAQLAQESDLVDTAARHGAGTNTPFSASERDVVKAQLREIRELLIASRDLTSEQQRAVESRVAYLEEASARMGRRDWLNIFVGTMFTLAVEAIVPPEAIREVLRIAARSLGVLFGDPSGFELPGV